MINLNINPILCTIFSLYISLFQSDVCASALSEVIPAVLEGSDGCLLAMGYPGTGQPQTVLGEVGSSGSGSSSSSGATCSLGAAPCAIAWLYKGIQERRQKSGARFSVRVSAVGVSATKPDSLSQDLLISHAAGKHMDGAFGDPEEWEMGIVEG